jgi:hypothetical protein
MTKRKKGVKLSPEEVMRGRQYPGVSRKIVEWVDHQFEEGILYIRVRFTDKTELCWRITASTLLEEVDLSDWKGGNFRSSESSRRTKETRNNTGVWEHENWKAAKKDTSRQRRDHRPDHLTWSRLSLRRGPPRRICGLGGTSHRPSIAPSARPSRRLRQRL